MPKLTQCIPNFSEGRDEKVIQALVDCAKSVPGVSLVDHSSDTSHNRSVFTLVGCPEGMEEVAFKLCKLASELIDMTKHTGEHPRMGATDVIPFVPVKEMSMDECVELSKRVGERIANELKIPVFLYEESAKSSSRVNLAAIRKGQFEGMAEKIKGDRWIPDFGGQEMHPTTGVVAVGARMPLVAFNVNLSTNNVDIANNIAKKVRGSSGGLAFVKGMGVYLEERDVAQVSMNLVNYEKTAIYTVVELIKAEAKRYGVHVIGCELIGLAPAKALIDCAEYYLQIEEFDYSKQVLENHLL